MLARGLSIPQGGGLNSPSVSAHPEVPAPSRCIPLILTPFLALLLAAAPSSQASRAEVDPPLAVVGGLLIDGTGAEPIPDSAIIIQGDRIMAAGPRRETRIPPGAVAVDATDLTVMPGLIDMHTHLVEGVRLKDFLRHGVTSVRHMGDTTLPYIVDLKAAVESGRLEGPRIFHSGRFVVSRPPLDSTSLSPEMIQRYSVIEKASDIPAVVKELKDAGADLVKVKAQMDRTFLEDLCREAGKHGLTVSFDAMGDRSYDAMDALEAGALGVEHLSGIDFQSPEAAEKVLRKMLETGAYAVPTFSVLERTFSEARISRHRRFIGSFYRRGGTVLAGSDAPARGTPAGSSLHEEIRHLVEAGLSPADALRAATGNAGRILGYQGWVGTIETGAAADLIILRGNPLEHIQDTRRIERVFKGGVQVWAAQAAQDQEAVAR